MSENAKKSPVTKILAVLLAVAIVVAGVMGVQNNTLSTAKTQLEATVADLTAKNETAANDLTTKQTELDASAAKVTELEAAAVTAADTAAADLAAKQAELDAANAKVAELEAAAVTAADAAAADLAAKQAEVDAAAADLAAKQAELDAANAKVAELEAAAVTAADAAAADLAAKQAELDAALADLAAKQAELDTANAALAAIQAELDAALAAAAVPAEAPAAVEEDPRSDDVVILYTNDVHTYIDGVLSYDVIAALKQELLKEYEYVLLVDAGDHAQGTAYGSMDKGETIIKLMNAAGYDIATLGNHEFDYGMDGCMNIIDWAEYPYISCNFYHEENNVRNENVLDAYLAVPCGDVTVALIGITTPESFTKSTPAYFQNENGEYIYGIAGGEDGAALYADVQDAIDDAKAAGATHVIALGHLGDDPSSEPWTSEKTIANVCGLNAFIDGHSHSTVEGKDVADKDGHTVLLTQTGEYFGRIGMMVIDAETGAIDTDFIELVELTEKQKNDKGEEEDVVVGYELASELYAGKELVSDADVKAIQDAWMQEIDTQLGTIIGSTALTFDNYNAEGKRMVRSMETNTGDFCADALYYLFDGMGLDVDVAIMNGGGVRNKAVTGDISYKVCKNIHTFGNVACLQTITGQQLLDALEWGARSAGTGEECGGFLQVAGISYAIDTAYPSSVQMDDKGVWTGAPTAGYRVHDVKVYNKETGAWDALDLAASYNLAGYNYTLRDLGDGFNMFDGAVNVLDYVMEDYMVLANYVQGFEGGVVDATNSPLAQYAGYLLDYGTVEGSGRIVLK